MDFDPKKIIEMTGEIVDSLGLIKRAKGLFPSNKPEKTRRRADWDPEKDGERRKSGVELRLKTGVWLQFHRKTDLGRSQLMETTERGNLVHAFLEESGNYHFLARGSNTTLQPSDIVTAAADFACAKMTKLPLKKRQAVLLTDNLAEYILAHYEVRMIDRRRGLKKQSAAGRLRALTTARDGCSIGGRG